MGNFGSTTVSLQNQKVVDLSNQQLNGISASPKNPIIIVLNLSNNSIQYLPKNVNSLNRLFLANNNYDKYLPNKIVDAIVSYSNLNGLDLSYNNLTYLSNEIVYKSSLNILNLFHNKFSDLEITSLNENLKMIDLGFNELTTIIDIEKIPNLKFLYIQNNKIQLFSLRHQSLVSLVISSNQINAFDMNSKLDSLTILDISRNRIEKLPNLSQVAPQLSILDASYNLISELPLTICRLYMNHNRIQTIPKWIEKYDKLYLINLQFNCVNAIESLPLSLQTLILTFNDIKEIPNQIDTPDLISISLTNNKLIHMPKFVCNQIFDISFYRNKLIDIDINCLCENISTLDLSNNQIEKVPSQLFTFSKLYYLNLSNNKIQYLSERIIASSLITLNISKNPIKKLPDGFPAPIECLCASFCGLTEFPESWTEAVELIDLNVSGNKLTEIPMIMSLLYLNASHNDFAVFPYLPPSIQKVDLSFNHITDFHDNFEYNVLEELNISNNLFTTFSPQGGLYLPNLRNLNVSCNPLNCELPFFSKMSKLVAINVDQLSTDLYNNDNNNSSESINSHCDVITNNQKVPNSTTVYDLGFLNDYQSYINFYYKNNNNNNNNSNASHAVCSAAQSYRKSTETFSDDDIIIWSRFHTYSNISNTFGSFESISLTGTESEQSIDSRETVLMILNAYDNEAATHSLSNRFLTELHELSSNGAQMTKSSLAQCISSVILPEFQNETTVSPSYLSLAVIRPIINSNHSTINLLQSNKKGQPQSNSNSNLSLNSSQVTNSNPLNVSEILFSRLGSCEIAIFDRKGKPRFIMNDGQKCMFSPNFNHGFAQYNDAKMLNAQYYAFMEDDFREFSLPHPKTEVIVNEYNNKSKNKIVSIEKVSRISLSKEAKWLVMSSPPCFKYIAPKVFEQIVLNEKDPWSISSKMKNIIESTQYEKNISIIVADLDVYNIL